MRRTVRATEFEQTEMNLPQPNRRTQAPEFDDLRERLQAGGVKLPTKSGVGLEWRAARQRPNWLAFILRLGRRVH